MVGTFKRIAYKKLGSGEASNDIDTGVFLDFGQWNNIAVVLNDDSLFVYKNGQQTYSTVSIYNTASGTDLFIGSNTQDRFDELQEQQQRAFEKQSKDFERMLEKQRKEMQRQQLYNNLLNNWTPVYQNKF